MSYPLRQPKGRSEWPLPEEQQVFEALKLYCFDPEKAGFTDFTPTRVLYETYLAYHAQFDYVGGEDFPDRLTETEFGVAVRRVFHLEDVPDRWVRRRVNGRVCKGYLYVRGPGSIVAQTGPGNPGMKRSQHGSRQPMG